MMVHLQCKVGVPAEQSASLPQRMSEFRPVFALMANSDCIRRAIDSLGVIAENSGNNENRGNSGNRGNNSIVDESKRSVEVRTEIMKTERTFSDPPERGTAVYVRWLSRKLVPVILASSNSVPAIEHIKDQTKTRTQSDPLQKCFQAIRLPTLFSSLSHSWSVMCQRSN